MWANMFLLFCLSLIPVVTEWLRDTYHEPLPAAAFGVVGLLAAFAYFLLVHAIIRANGRDSLVGAAIASDIKAGTKERRGQHENPHRRRHGRHRNGDDRSRRRDRGREGRGDR
jgi:hypothetical protein